MGRLAANTYAWERGKTQFLVYQKRWNVMQRHLERDDIPMARQFGIGTYPWNVLSGSKFQTRKQIEAKKKADEGMRGMFGGDQSEYSGVLAGRWSMLLRSTATLLLAGASVRSSCGRVVGA